MPSESDKWVGFALEKVEVFLLRDREDLAVYGRPGDEWTLPEAHFPHCIARIGVPDSYALTVRALLKEDKKVILANLPSL